MFDCCHNNPFLLYSWLQFVSPPVVRVLVWIVSIIGGKLNMRDFDEEAHEG